MESNKTFSQQLKEDKIQRKSDKSNNNSNNNHSANNGSNISKNGIQIAVKDNRVKPNNFKGQNTPTNNKRANLYLYNQKFLISF